MIQHRYGQLPFAEYYAEVGQRPVAERDVSVADLVAFICEQPQPRLDGAGVTLGKTLLIGLDGATFTVLDPLMERGVMPFLQRLAARGVRAPLRTVMPPLTPPAWTSLMTGKRPGQHGVFDFFQKETPDSEYFHFASSQDVAQRDHLVASRATTASASSRSTSR